VARLATTTSTDITLATNILGHIIIQNSLTSLAGSAAWTEAREDTTGLAFADSIH
jgi:hypothetical protein